MNSSGRNFKQQIASVLDATEDHLYGILALLLVAIALLALWATIETIGSALSRGEIVEGVIEVLDKVLLVLMIGEILYTVVLTFRSHALLPEPFLVVALIAAVRRVLLISLEAAHPSAIESTKFQNYMIELGVLGFLVAVFVASLRVLGKKSGAHSSDQISQRKSLSMEE